MKTYQIRWKRGSAAMLLGVFIMLIGVSLLLLVTECGNLYWANTVVTTRVDAVADGAAVYAQSYDWKLNKPQAQIMTAMLTTANDDDTDRYKLFTSVTFEDDTKMTVKGTVSTDYLYPSYHDTEEYIVSAQTNVEAIDAYGDILVVPGKNYSEEDLD